MSEMINMAALDTFDLAFELGFTVEASTHPGLFNLTIPPTRIEDDCKTVLQAVSILDINTFLIRKGGMEA